MGFKIGNITEAKVTRKIKFMEGEILREEKITVGMKIYRDTEYIALKQALLDGGSKDVNLDFAKTHGITSIDGPEYKEGGAMSVDDCLDVPYIRAPVETIYQEVANGIIRKN